VAWTGTPKTWPFQGALLSSDFNAEIRDRFLAMGPHLIARRIADQPNSTTTLANEDTLVPPTINANESWLFWWILWISTTTTDVKFGFTFPSGNIGALVDGVSGSRAIDNASGGSTTCTSAFNVSWPAPHMLKAQYVCGATPGTLQLKFAPAVAGTTTFKTHSTLWGVKLA
jgi:hypothetical protein